MIDKLKRLSGLLSELENEGLISISLSGEKFIHIWSKKFLQHFTDFEIAKRTGDHEFPYEVFVMIDDIKVLAILTQEDYEKHVLKEVV